MLAIQSKLLLQNLLAWQLYFTLLTEKRRCVKPFLGTHTSSLPVCLNMKTSWDGFFCALTVLAHGCHNCIYFWWVAQKKIQLHKDNSSIFISVRGFGPLPSSTQVWWKLFCLFCLAMMIILKGIPSDLSDYQTLIQDSAKFAWISSVHCSSCGYICQPILAFCPPAFFSVIQLLFDFVHHFFKRGGQDREGKALPPSGTREKPPQVQSRMGTATARHLVATERKLPMHQWSWNCPGTKRMKSNLGERLCLPHLSLHVAPLIHFSL